MSMLTRTFGLDLLERVLNTTAAAFLASNVVPLGTLHALEGASVAGGIEALRCVAAGRIVDPVIPQRSPDGSLIPHPRRRTDRRRNGDPR